MKNALATDVVFHKIDAENGEGPALAKTYRVSAYPTFVVTTADGEVIDRWLGYGSPEPFLASLAGAVADPTTLDQKLARFREKPGESDARKLGEIRAAEGFYGEAVAWYRRARDLDTEGKANHQQLIFDAMARGARYKLYTLDELVAQADAALKTDRRSAEDVLEIASIMGNVARSTGKNDLYLPYLRAAMDAARDADLDPAAAAQRAELEVDHALLVQKDTERAIRLKKASMPEGWLENANQINNFAWWCFENRINLEEADRLARKGVELAAPGRERGNVLDTLAEICNARDNCTESVEIMRRAVAEDPENEYFQAQLARFQALLSQRN